MRHLPAVAIPTGEAAVEFQPGLTVEARVGELAVAQRAGRGAECEVARGLALVTAAAVGIGGGHRRIGQVAGRVAVAGLADVSQQLAVARAPLEAEGFFPAPRPAAAPAAPDT